MLFRSQSKEKIDSLESLGAELHLVPATSYSDERHYIHAAERLAEKLSDRVDEGAFWARQFDNIANMQMHYQTTGQEIWQQTEGEVDAFICSVGTGGTVAGVSRALKEHKPETVIAVADPMGASLYSYYTTGELAAEGSSIAEGIGINHLTDNLKEAQVDRAYRVRDEEIGRAHV